MEICRNKNSGNCFIYIQKSGIGEALFVTPDAQVKSLSTDLFDEVEEYTETHLMERLLVNAAQVQRFNDYKKSRSQENLDKFEYHFDRLSPDEKKEFIRKHQEIADKNQKS